MAVLFAKAPSCAAYGKADAVVKPVNVHSAMVAVPQCATTVAVTVKLALAFVPVSTPLMKRSPVVLVYVPLVEEVTVAVIVQPVVGIVAFDKVMEVVVLLMPPQVLVAAP